MSAQPLDWVRFGIFLGVSILVVLVAQTFGLLVGAVFSVVVSAAKVARLNPRRQFDPI